MSDPVIISGIAAVTGVLTAVLSSLTAIRLGRLHQQLNSRLDQLLTSEKAVSRAEGVAEEKAKTTL